MHAHYFNIFFSLANYIYSATFKMAREPSMKKMLMIAYHYPPFGGGGVFRTLKFTKYLPKFGFQPYVLTVKNPMYMIRDPKLLREIPPEAKVFRAFSFEHRALRVPRLLNIDLKWFYIPDVNIGWLPFAFHAGVKIIEKEEIDTIFVTAPPFTSFLVGYLLKRKTGKPLILDFRDPWTDSPFTEYPTKLHENIEKKMEEIIVTHADYVIGAGNSIKHSLIKKYPFIKSKIEVITNGFDPDDFKNLKIHEPTNKFRITHTGSLYGVRTARPVLLALKELTEEKPDLRKKLEIMFVGKYGKETPLLVRNFRLEDTVKLIRYISHKECLELMLNSHALLLLITAKGPRGKGILTGKLFEYLACQRPILAIAPENGAAADIIKSLKAGTVVSPDKIQLIKQTILEFYKKWKQDKLAKIISDITKYDRRFLTQRLAQIFEKVTSDFLDKMQSAC
jgi:glycosyltransferase involved in cell wall biosynthesis